MEDGIDDRIHLAQLNGVATGLDDRLPSAALKVVKRIEAKGQAVVRYLNPMTLPFGMYATAAVPKNGSRWCSHSE